MITVDTACVCTTNPLLQLEVVAVIGKLYPGTGSTGTVSIVRNKETGSLYALKTIDKLDNLGLPQIIQEKEILSTLASPFFPTLHASFQHQKAIYFLQEFIPGGELFNRIKSQEGFSNDIALFYAAELLCIITHLHSHGIVHRDIKPENLLIDKTGHLKLIDFGLAKKSMERSYSIMGTPEFMAPEVISRAGHGKAVDWWCFGIVVYEMLTNSLPFDAEDPLTLYTNILTANFTIPEEVTPEARNLIEGLLDPNPESRLGSRQGGATEVMEHPWFSGVSWEEVKGRKIDAPWEPKARYCSGPRYFDYYSLSEINLPVAKDDLGNF